MTPSSKSHSHYHRFIPSEEVQQVKAWEFESMDGNAKNRQENASPEEAPAAPSPDMLEELRQQAYAEGFEHGRLAGAQETKDALEAPLKQQGREQAQRLSTLMNQAQNQFGQLEDLLAEQVLALACDLARQVVRRELAQPLEPLKAVVHEALALAVQDGRPATLRLHPSDLALLQAELAAPMAEQNIRLMADGQLTPGGCVVESAQGAVDGTVEKRWARAVANLGLNPTWKPGEDADV